MMMENKSYFYLLICICNLALYIYVIGMNGECFHFPNCNVQTSLTRGVFWPPVCLAGDRTDVVRQSGNFSQTQDTAFNITRSNLQGNRVKDGIKCNDKVADSVWLSWCCIYYDWKLIEEWSKIFKEIKINQLEEVMALKSVKKNNFLFKMKVI